MTKSHNLSVDVGVFFFNDKWLKRCFVTRGEIQRKYFSSSGFLKTTMEFKAQAELLHQQQQQQHSQSQKNSREDKVGEPFQHALVFLL